jgi:hypothetical protein
MRKKEGSGSVPLTNKSVSWRPKNTRSLQIRIRIPNTNFLKGIRVKNYYRCVEVKLPVALAIECSELVFVVTVIIFLQKEQT